MGRWRVYRKGEKESFDKNRFRNEKESRITIMFVWKAAIQKESWMIENEFSLQKKKLILSSQQTDLFLYFTFIYSFIVQTD